MDKHNKKTEKAKNHALYILNTPIQFVRETYTQYYLAPYKESMDRACGKLRPKREAEKQVKRILVIKAEVFNGANY